MGTARFGSPLSSSLYPGFDRKRSWSLLDGAVDIGCTAFDTAASYQAGGTERFIGSWISSRRNRDRLFIISKGGHPHPFSWNHRLTPREISADLNGSLRRLGTERLDLYLLHRDDERAPLEPIVETMTTLQQQGKIRAWGVSNFTHVRVRSIIGLAQKVGATSPAASSPHFSLLEWVTPPWRGCVSIAGEGHREAREYYEREQMPVLAWSPLGSGFFSLSGRPSKTYASPANVGRRRRAEELAKKYNRTSAQIALAYLYNQPFPVFAVVAASSVERMQLNLEATTLRLTPRETRWLELGEGS